MRLPLKALCTCALAIGTSACGPEPVYDEELDLQAVSVAPGTLAGSWARFTRAVGPIQTPFGEAPSGNDDFILVTRTWDAAEQTYAETAQLCGGYYIPVLETQTIIPPETWRKVPASTGETTTVDEGLGTYEMKDHLQLWALRDLEDPVSSPLPETRDGINESFLEHVYDLDDDGNVGVTFLSQGVVNGEIYSAQRKTTDLDGLILSEDRIVGRSEHLYEFLVLEAVPALLEVQPQFNQTDRAQSWFEEIRLTEGADCSDVQAKVDDETLGTRPF